LKVGCEVSKGRSAALSIFPFTWLCLPVSTTARLGAQMAFVQKLFRKMAPSSAIRSMFGVRLIRDPYAEMACGAWSSEKMKRTLGRSRATAGAHRASAGRAPRR